MFGINNVEQANVAINQAREKLAQAAEAGMLRELSNAVNAVAHAEGVAEVHYLKERMEDNGVSPELIALELAGRMSNGADDGWSGRGNDVQRSRFDGFREAAQIIISNVRYDMERKAEALDA